MKQLLVLLTLITPILLNAQKSFQPYVGVGLGTFTQGQHFKGNPFNFSVAYGYTYKKKNWGLGFLCSYNFFPKFNYLETNTELMFANLGTEFFISSKDNGGFIIGGTVEYPAIIDDGFKKIQKKKPIPSINIGISEKKFTLLLSYKYYNYTNNYKVNPRHEHFDVIETIRIGTIRLVYKYQLVAPKSKNNL